MGQSESQQANKKEEDEQQAQANERKVRMDRFDKAAENYKQIHGQEKCLSFYRSEVKPAWLAMTEEERLSHSRGLPEYRIEIGEVDGKTITVNILEAE
jgi:hypothetical protein